MRSKDIAWLMALVDLHKAPYNRKTQVQSELQELYKHCRTKDKAKCVYLRVSTQYGEAEAAASAEKAAKERAKKKKGKS